MLGIDPGTRVAGFGVVDAAGTRLELVEAGALRARRDAPLEERLASIARGLREIVARVRPTVAAVEDVFVRTDPRAALSIGHARGAVLAVLGEAGIPVHSYAPATIKRCVAGNGRADKQAVARMIAVLLGLAQPPRPADATDALAAAIAYTVARKTQDLAGS